MIHKIDLHGMSIRKAVSKAELFLIEASFDKSMHVKVITGKSGNMQEHIIKAVSYTHLRAHETVLDLVCRLLLEKKK